MKDAIAIIGMTGRFPGAATLDELWTNLRDGRETVRFPDRAELIAAGGSEDLLSAPGYVGATSEIDGIDLFDAELFGIGARQAELMDPQQRVFLECAWEALESAGYNGDRSRVIGCFAGCTINTYLLFNVAKRIDLSSLLSTLPVYLGNDKDYLAPLVSYKLDLTGPSVTCQTACSTALVAVHMACQSLLAGECDLALAGAVSIRPPLGRGYIHEEGMISSRDGHTRAFDRSASGTMFGSGAGVVVLARLEDAVEARDPIRAVILGTAVNNDGARKATFHAPSIRGQAGVIAEALAVAAVDARSISYVEAHGTGTQLGDPIEIEALTQAFRESTDACGFCAIGSVKTNVGHLEVAAGAIGLIKTVLALEHRELPPSLHFETPNPEIAFESSPFFVNSSLSGWTGPTPLRAGVSSFGMGGTNAHLILEEAPRLQPARGAPERPQHLLALSGRTAAAANTIAAKFRDELLRDGPAAADVCFTAGVGRRQLAHRIAVVGESRGDLAASLEHAAASGPAPESPPGVAFLFTGQGSQRSGMARALFESSPPFRSSLERCAEIARPLLDRPLLDVMFGEPSLIDQTAYTQPALFAVEWSLFELLRSWGVTPAAVLGHSVGEYVAACAASAIEPADALRLVAERGRLMQSLPAGGGMLAAGAPEDRVGELIAGRSLSIAAANSPESTVVAGEIRRLNALAHDLERAKIPFKRLAVSHAFHSPLIEPILPGLHAAASRVSYQRPKIPMVWNLTGEPNDEIPTAEYWCAQAKSTVRFADGLRSLARLGIGHFGEIGPTPDLTRMGRSVVHGEWIPFLRPDAEWKALLDGVGRLYVAGAPIDFRAIDAPYPRRRVPLPTYPFERSRYWIDGDAERRHEPRPSHAVEWVHSTEGAVADRRRRWSIVSDDPEAHDELARRLVELGDDVGNGMAADLDSAIVVVTKEHSSASAIAPLAGSTVRIASQLHRNQGARLVIASVGSNAAGTALRAMASTLTQEHAALDCRAVAADSIEALAGEAKRKSREMRVALRGEARRVARLRPVASTGSAFRVRSDASYWITGGLGGLGTELARWLVGRGAKHVLLTGRSRPDGWAATPGASIALGDVRRSEDVRAIVATLVDRAPLAAIFHLAGVYEEQSAERWTDDVFLRVAAPKIDGAWNVHSATQGLALDAFVLFSSIASVFGAPCSGAYAIANGFLDGLAELRRSQGVAATSIRWGVFAQGGMSKRSHLDATLAELGLSPLASAQAFDAMADAIGAPAPVIVPAEWHRFTRATGRERDPFFADVIGLPKIEEAAAPMQRKPRPPLSAEYVAPRSEAEATLAALIADVMGFERIGVRDDFVELGGDSMTALQVATRARKSGISFDVARFLEHATVEGVAGVPSSPARGPSASGTPDSPDPYPLTPTQQAMLFEHLLHPEGTAYFQQTSFVIEGTVDLKALRRAIEQVVERHDVLRTSIDPAGPEGYPVQRVHSNVGLPWVELDERATGRAIDEILAEDRSRGFDFGRPPIARVTLVRVADDRIWFVFSHHHILMEGWSTTLLLDEALQIYRGLLEGEAPQLPEPHRFREFVDWLDHRDPVEAERFWREAFAGFDEPALLSSSPGTGTTFAEVQLEWTREATADLNAAARSLRVTQSALVQAGWAELIRRYTRRPGITYGLAVSGRPPELPDVDRRIGLFINTVPVRIVSTGDEPIADVARGIHRLQAQRRRFEHAPLTAIKRWIGVKGDQPLFDHILVFENYPQGEQLDRLRSDLRIGETRLFQHNHHPFTLFVIPGETLRMKASFDVSTLDRGFAQNVLEHLRELLGSAVRAPATPSKLLAIMGEAARRRLLMLSDGTDRSLVVPAAVHHPFEIQARESPDIIAAELGDESIGYGELNAWADRIAFDLVERGIGRGHVVGVRMERSIEMIAAIFGILKAGAAYLPLDPSYPAERLRFMVEDVSSPATLTLERVRDRRRHAIDRSPDVVVTGEDDAYVMYTSGSTGVPKGVVLPHRPLATLIAWHARAVSPGGRTLQFASLSFDASFHEIFAALSFGGTAVIPTESTRHDPAALAQLCIDRRIEKVILPVTMLQALAEWFVARSIVPESLVEVMATGEQLVVTSGIRRFFELARHCRLHNHYGPTETHVATALTLGGEPSTWPGHPSIGRPIANAQAYVLDDGHQLLPIGVAGELYLAGDCLARGYWARPELTTARFVSNPFDPGKRMYRTGDLARLLADGSFEFLGRTDHQVKIRGFRVELGEVEAALLEHEAIEHCVVIADDRGATKRLVAYLVLAAGHALSVDAARRHMAERLPAFMIPSVFVFLDALPLTPTQKIDRRALPTVGDDRPILKTAFQAPATSVEQALAEIWSVALSVRPIGLSDNFFDLGGDSIVAVSVFARVRETFGVRLPLEAIMHHPTVGALAAQIEARPLEQPRSPVVTLRGGDRGSLILAHPLGGNLLCYGPLIRNLPEGVAVFGVQATKETGRLEASSIDSLAAAYVAEIDAPGPIGVAGWSIGGVLALGLARRLRDVRFVGLIDSVTPDEIDDADIALSFAAERWLDEQGRLLEHYARVSGMSALERESWVESMFGGDALEVFRTYRSNFDVLRGLTFSTYDGRVVLFRAEEQARVHDPSRWKALLGVVPAIRTVPGNHFTVLRPPAVSLLAGAIALEVERAFGSDGIP